MRMRRAMLVALAILASLGAGAANAQSGAKSADAPRGYKFDVTVPASAGAEAIDGRLLLILSTDGSAEPRLQVENSVRTQMVFGIDVNGVKPGTAVTIDDAAFGFPVRYLHDVPHGDYYIQVVLNKYETFHRADGTTVKLPMDRGEGQHWQLAPGNLYSKPEKVDLHVGGEVALTLDQVIAPIPDPADTEFVRHIKIQSALLTKFWGRPMYLSANVLVPYGFDTHPEAHFPLMISEDHFNDDFHGLRTVPPDADLKPDHSERFHIDAYNRTQQEEEYKFYQIWISAKFPRYLVAQLNHANPYYDDSYAVNSANLGPYGDAIETELIPAIEKKFRAIGAGWARFVYGGSTGGWESLAVQTFYPDHYNGASWRVRTRWISAASPTSISTKIKICFSSQGRTCASSSPASAIIWAAR